MTDLDANWRDRALQAEDRMHELIAELNQSQAKLAIAVKTLKEYAIDRDNWETAFAALKEIEPMDSNRYSPQGTEKKANFMKHDLNKIDALVVEHAVGCKVINHGFGRYTVPGLRDAQVEVPCYSQAMSDAWDLTYLCVGAADNFKLVRDYEGLWNCNIGWTNEAESRNGSSSNCDTAPLAICLAILNAYGVEV